MTGPRPFGSKTTPEPAKVSIQSRDSVKRLAIYSGIAGSIALLLLLHYSTTPDKHTWHNIYTELHYVPLLIAAVAFGTRGALITYGTILLLYLPIVFNGTIGSPVELLNKVLHLSFSGLVAALVGYLVHRERRMRKQAEDTKYLAGVGQAAASIVHDLKNPLIVASGFSNRIKAGKGDPASNIQPVIESIADMQQIVADVLDVTRTPKPNLTDCDLNTIVGSACGTCRPKAERKGVNLSLEPWPELWMVAIDEAMMKRSLVNLIDNAIDASASGQTVQVSVATGQGAWRLVISDEGHGMDAETLANLFTPFYSKKTRGTGLGMAIARKHIEAHGGQIKVESSPESGTTITIEMV